MTCSLACIKFNWKTKELVHKLTKGGCFIDLVLVMSREEKVDKYWMSFSLKKGYAE